MPVIKSTRRHTLMIDQPSEIASFGKGLGDENEEDLKVSSSAMMTQTMFDNKEMMSKTM